MVLGGGLPKYLGGVPDYSRQCMPPRDGIGLDTNFSLFFALGGADAHPLPSTRPNSKIFCTKRPKGPALWGNRDVPFALPWCSWISWQHVSKRCAVRDTISDAETASPKDSCGNSGGSASHPSPARSLSRKRLTLQAPPKHPKITPKPSHCFGAFTGLN